MPGADGLKTGHTDEAGYGFTGSAEQNGRRLIEVLAGLPSWNARVEESTRLIQWGFGAWTAKPLFPAGAKIGTAQVQMGQHVVTTGFKYGPLQDLYPAGIPIGASQSSPVAHFPGAMKWPTLSLCSKSTLGGEGVRESQMMAATHAQPSETRTTRFKSGRRASKEAELP